MRGTYPQLRGRRELPPCQTQEKAQKHRARYRRDHEPKPYSNQSPFIAKGEITQIVQFKAKSLVEVYML